MEDSLLNNPDHGSCLRRDSRRLKLLYVGSLPWELSAGGPLQLRRHFVDSGDYDFYSIIEPKATATSYLMTGFSHIDRMIQRGSNTRFYPEVLALNGLIGARRDISKIAESAADYGADAIVTIAFGAYGLAAGEVAHRLGLPLISFFHDWWPDLMPCRGIGKRFLDEGFRRLYRQSTVALCVSPEIREELGCHDQAPVLYPIPASNLELEGVASPVQLNRPFRLVYLGTMEGNYGKMIQSLVSVHLRNPRRAFELTLFGSATDWPADLLRAAVASGIYRGCPSDEQCVSELRDADGFLIVMNFDDSDRRRVRTSFPSKFLEYSRYGKPVVAWAPDYAAITRFFRYYECGLSIVNPSAEDVVNEVASLCADKTKCAIFGDAARHLSKTIFNHNVIHAELRQHIARAVFESL